MCTYTQYTGSPYLPQSLMSNSPIEPLTLDIQLSSDVATVDAASATLSDAADDADGTRLVVL